MVKTDNYKICHKCNAVMRPQTVEEAFQMNGRLLKTGTWMKLRGDAYGL